MKQNILRRSFERLPLIIIAVVSLLGTFWTVNLHDFQAFVDAGIALQAGENPYQNYTKVISTNLNPPISLFAFRFLANVDPLVAYRTWTVISLVLYLVLVIILARAYPKTATLTCLVWAFALSGIWYTLLVGQLYVFLLLLVVAAWLLLRKGRWVAAGLLMGILAALKPNFLVWPGLLFLAGAWIPAVTAGIVAGLLSLIPLAVFGPWIYREWLSALAACPAGGVPTNVSLFGFFTRSGVPLFGYVAGAFLLLGASWLVWRKKLPPMDVSALAIVLILVVSPFVWLGYTVLLLPVYLSREWGRLIKISAGLMIVPGILVAATTEISDLAAYLAGLIYIIALILLLIALAQPYFRDRNLQLETVEGRRKH